MQQNPASLPLRDIHLPDTVLWWPLAWGWWLIIALLVIVVIVIIGWFYYRQQKSNVEQQAITQALTQLVQITADYEINANKRLFVSHISRLLRRICISLYGRKQVAALTGDSWLRFLDRKGKTSAFTQGIGRILVDHPYQKKVDYSQQELLHIVQLWLKKQRTEHA